MVITTAQVPGRRPPLLVTEEAIKAMPAGSVVVDMAAGPLGGNVAGSVPGETIVTGNGVTMIGAANLAAGVPPPPRPRTPATSRAAAHLVPDGALAIDLADEIQAGVVVTHGGSVVHPATAALLADQPAGVPPSDQRPAHDLTIFVLALLVGFEVISKVPATLHTPLMSAANSIHGIVLVGAMLIAATAHNGLGYILAFIATAFAAMNVVGGYVVTERMLKMFHRRPGPGPGRAGREGRAGQPGRAGSQGDERRDLA